MTRLMEPSAEQVAEWRGWVSGRPENVRAVAEKFDPWSLYRIKSTGQRVTLVSFGEQEDGDVTLTVNVTGQFNLIAFDREVFGVEPDDLEPCDPPDKGEIVGTVLTDEGDIDAYVDEIRPLVLKARGL